MKRRLRWIIPALIMIVVIAIAAWPREHGDDFLRHIGGHEFWEAREVRHGPSTPTQKVHVFRFDREPLPETEAALKKNWGSPSPEWKTASGATAYIDLDVDGEFYIRRYDVV